MDFEEEGLSVSRGCFVYKKEGFRKKSSTTKKAKDKAIVPILEADAISSPWYTSYQMLWNKIEKAIIDIQAKGYHKILEDLLQYVKYAHNTIRKPILPIAAILTGINQPDHLAQFVTISENINKSEYAHVIILKPRDCNNMKNTIELIASGFIEATNTDEMKSLRRSNYTLEVLKSWYNDRFEGPLKPNLTIIIPNFEGFNSNILQELIIILSSHCVNLPFVLILGIATSIASVHNSLPYHVTNRINLTVFQSEPSTVNLNKILEGVILTPNCPIHLSGKSFKLLIDIFLFYDFSVNSFMQGFKYCLMEHYFYGNAYALCNNDLDKVKSIINNLNHDELESIRYLQSFRRYIERQTNSNKIIKLIEDDEYFRRRLPEMISDIKDYWFNFHCSLEILLNLVQDLPKYPLGKQLRELYTFCMCGDLIQQPEFIESMKLTAMLSQNSVIEKLAEIIKIIRKYVNNVAESPFNNIENKLLVFADRIKHFEINPNMGNTVSGPESLRFIIEDCVNYMKASIFTKYLRPLENGPPLLELTVFSDAKALRQHIVGSPRAAVHTALTNPQSYLQCNCCEVSSSTDLLPTFPDLSVAYKLHLESSRMINLYDWLQAFRMVITSIDDDAPIDPKIQARFTRAVAELQFLGFIKTSKKKADHVARLTW